MARRTDYPIYSVCAIKEGCFCVAGGGGAVKTGVPNVLVRIAPHKIIVLGVNIVQLSTAVNLDPNLYCTKNRYRYKHTND